MPQLDSMVCVARYWRPPVRPSTLAHDESLAFRGERAGRLWSPANKASICFPPLSRHRTIDLNPRFARSSAVSAEMRYWSGMSDEAGGIRGAEQRQLRQLILSSPQIRVVTVRGEAGLGKTTMLAGVADAAAGAGWRVLRVSSSTSEARLSLAGLFRPPPNRWTAGRCCRASRRSCPSPR